MPTESIKIRNFIDGEFVEPLGGKYLDNIEPATGKPYALVPDSEARDVDLAVTAAERAFPTWSKTPAADRSRPRCRQYGDRETERAHADDRVSPLRDLRGSRLAQRRSQRRSWDWPQCWRGDHRSSEDRHDFLHRRHRDRPQGRGSRCTIVQ